LRTDGRTTGDPDEEQEIQTESLPRTDGRRKKEIQTESLPRKNREEKRRGDPDGEFSSVTECAKARVGPATALEPFVLRPSRSVQPKFRSTATFDISLITVEPIPNDGMASRDPAVTHVRPD